MEKIGDDGQGKQIELINDSKEIDQGEDKNDKKSKKTVGFAKIDQQQNQAGSICSVSQSGSEEDDEDQDEKDQKLEVNQEQKNSKLPELPVKPKVSIQEEISNVVKQIEKKNSVKRASSFFYSKFTEKVDQDDQNQEHSKDEDQKQTSNDGQNEEINQEQNIQEQNRLPERPRFGVQEEIQSVVQSIDKKRSFKRQSTFSQIARQEQAVEEQDNNEDQQSGLNLKEINQEKKVKEEEAHNIEKTIEKQEEVLPERPKVSVQEEIISVVRSIEKKRSVKRQSTFSLAAKSGKDDLNGNIGLAEVAESSEETDQNQGLKQQIKDNQDFSENSQNDTNQNQVTEQQQLPVRPQFGVQEEIKSVVRDIEKKRSVKRQSTFSIAKYEKEDEQTGDINENTIEIDQKVQNSNPAKEQLLNTGLTKVVEISEEDNQHHESPNTEEKGLLEKRANQHEESQKTNQQSNLPSRPQFGVQDEIKNVIRDIEKKRSIKRQSTFSILAKKIEQTNEEISLDGIAEDVTNKPKENEEASDIVKEAQQLDSVDSKKPNALQEVIELTGQIEQKKETRRKSNFALLGQPHFEADTENQHTEEQQLDKLSIGYSATGANQFGQLQEQAIEAIVEVNQEDHQHQSEEAVLQRQKKKKNIMDYKEEVRVEKSHKKQDHQQKIHKERKMVFFKDSTAKHNKKVIHPTNSRHEARQEMHSLKSREQSTPIPIQSNSPQNQEEIVILEDHSKEGQYGEPISKKQNKEHRDRQTLQSKLECLTATSAKSELTLKRDVIAYNKQVETQLTKEIKAKEANKKKRELEAMLIKLNQEIEFVKSVDPDLEPLSQLKIEQQRLKDETKAGYMSSIMKSSRHSSSSSFDGHKQSSQMATPDLKTKLINNQILPQLKIHNPFKEITTKIYEKNNSGKHYEQTSSFIQQIRLNKESKKIKKEEESTNFLSSQEDHIQKEIAFRRVQNENLHDKWMNEKQQQYIQKKLKYESNFEHSKSIIASKSQANRLLGTGSPLKSTINSIGQQQQVGEQHSILTPSYLTPELDAHKQGLKALRKLNKGEYYTGSAYILTSSKVTKQDNSNLKKLLEENQINRDRELQLMQNRNDFYLNSKQKGQKSVIPFQNYQKQPQQKQQEGQKLEISQSLLFQQSEENQFKSHSTKNNRYSYESHKETIHNHNQAEQEQQSLEEQNNTANNQATQNNQTLQGEDMKGLSNSKMWSIKHKHS